MNQSLLAIPDLGPWLIAAFSARTLFQKGALLPCTEEAGLVFIVGERGSHCMLASLHSQIEGVVFMVLLQALTVRVSKDPSSTCALDQDGALDWTSKHIFKKQCWMLSCTLHVLHSHPFLTVKDPARPISTAPISDLHHTATPSGNSYPCSTHSLCCCAEWQAKTTGTLTES